MQRTASAHQAGRHNSVRVFLTIPPLLADHLGEFLAQRGYTGLSEYLHEHLRADMGLGREPPQRNTRNRAEGTDAESPRG